MSNVQVAPRMPLLFARYVAGQISDATWSAFSEIVDAFDTSDERTALIAFFNDAIEELGLDAIKLPARSEAESVVQAIVARA